MDSYSLIENSQSKFPKLKIIYNDDLLDTFSIAQLKIKNMGNTSIKANDVAPTDPIKITTADNKTEIIEAEIIYQSENANNLHIEKIDDHSAIVTFDYLYPKDYVTIQIYHTGISLTSLKVSGSIIDEDTPFVKSEKKYDLSSKFVSVPTSLFRFAIDPKLRWLRIVLNFFIGIGLISYAFLYKPKILIWLFLVIFGTLSLYTGIKRIVKPEKTISDEKLKMLKYSADASVYGVTKKWQELFDSLKSKHLKEK